MGRRLIVIGILFLAVLLTGVTLTAANVQSSNAAQAVIVVDSFSDTLDSGDGCTLREAIMNANSDSNTFGDCTSGLGSDTITVPEGTYTLVISGTGENGNLTGDLDITDDLTLNGAGMNSTTIDANQRDRVFHVLNGAAVHINDLTITGGLVTGESGGGLLNESGYLTVTNSLVSHNVVSGTGLVGGGGLASTALAATASTSIHNSEVYSNRSYAPLGGGGVIAFALADFTAQMTLSNSIVRENKSWSSGGGVNAVYQGPGTGQLQLTVERSTIDGNIAKSNGGGLMTQLVGGATGQLKSIIVDSTLSNNIADGSLPGGGVGGGMYTTGETMFLRSAVFDNKAKRIDGGSLGAGGGIGSFGTLEVTNSTISDNHAEGASGSFGLEGIGGGIASVSQFTLTNSTVADNTAVVMGGGIATATFADPATTTFENSIVADNSAPTDAGCTNLFGVQNSNGNNLEDGNTCNFTASDDQINTKPDLGPLQDNGGDTLTHALLFGSPAIDAGNCPGTITDQRGFSRPVDILGVPNVADGCDIGAYEVPETPSFCRTPNLAIPDDDGDGVADTLNISDPGIILDVDVVITASHSLVGDLIFSLEHDGDTVTIIDRPGIPPKPDVCDKADIAATLDDDALLPVEDECSPTPPAIGGRFQPNEPLSTFNLDDITGGWTLTVSDNEPDDTGTLEEWCLVIEYEEAIEGLSASNDSPTVIGNLTSLTATISAGTNVNYTWDFGDGDDGSGAIANHAYSDVGAYTAVVTASNQVSSLRASTVVNIVDEPIAGLAASNDSPTVLGSPTNLMATKTAGTNVSYDWAFGDGEMGVGAMVTHTYPALGAYTATVTATNSLDDSPSAFTVVNIVDEPISGLSATNDSPTELGSPTNLSATKTAGTNVSYDWAFGDGDTASGASVNHTYPAAGPYTAVVTATNGVSTEMATTTLTITDITEPDLTIYLPVVYKE